MFSRPPFLGPENRLGRLGWEAPVALRTTVGERAAGERERSAVTGEGSGAMDSMSMPPIRVVVAKPGLDGHDRGVKLVARALRDAGMEVVYTGLHQTPEQIVSTALAEDADAIGLSVLSGAHMTLFARVLELLADAHAQDIVVFGGGIIPEEDRAPLADLGVAQVFTPGATMAEIVAWTRAHVRPSAVA